MFGSLRFFLRGLAYDLRKGMLARPAALTLGYATFAVLMVAAEQAHPGLTKLASRIAWIEHEDVAASQLILGTIAGSMMTTVSVVFSVLIMALSLASLQFSPRVLRGFMGDRPTQHTLGIFVGTFVYCLVVLRTVRGGADPFVPAASVSVAILLATGALGWLVYFIHHIGHGINANVIVDRIAGETIQIIDEEFPITVGRADTHPEDCVPSPMQDDATMVEATRSGYVQLIDRERLLELARAHDLVIHQQHGIGEFVVEGNPLVAVVPAARVTDELREACVECFDLGEVRTMQQDIQYGVRQIVDIGLKAISPAVNDPTTAVTCIDHLGRILCHLARRRILPLEMRDEKGRILMVRRAATFRGTLDLAFNQLRQFARSDLSVSLRLVRSLTEIALATDHPPHQERALHHAALVEAELSPSFSAADREELALRLRTLRARVAPKADLSETRAATLLTG